MIMRISVLVCIGDRLVYMLTCSLLLILLRLNASTAADVWVTYPDQSRLISWDRTVDFTDDAAVTPETITVDDSTKFQVIEGFGAALTDSATWLISTLTEESRNAVMQNLFGFEDGNAGISYLRIPLGATDIARYFYTYDDAESADPELNQFSISHDLEYTIPIAQQALRIDPNIKFLGSPWTAPAWMKTSNNYISGNLSESYYPAYADYFRKIVDSYRDAGVPFHAITVQNEPLVETYNYPSMRFDVQQELNFVRDQLYNRLQGTGVSILTFDHNWDQGDYAKQVMSQGAALYAGSAWHCYAGDPSAMGSMHDAYPDKDIYLTECTRTIDNTDFGTDLQWLMQNLFIGSTRNWAKTVLLWSLALDPNGGPHTGGCSRCRGVISIDNTNGDVSYNVEFYSIAHFARFVWPGANRIASTDSSDGNFIASAFVNPDGHKAVVVFNQGSSGAVFKLIWNGKALWQWLPASAVATVFWS